MFKDSLKSLRKNKEKHSCYAKESNYKTLNE